MQDSTNCWDLPWCRLWFDRSHHDLTLGK